VAEALGALLTPPLSLLVLAAIGAALRRRRRRLGNALIAAALALLVLLSLPLVSALLLRSLQTEPALAALDPRCGAIVVLAADASVEAPEYGGATVGPMTLERVRYGAHLARATGLPLLVSGGSPRRGLAPLAQTMKEVLEDELGLAVRWVEPRSETTRDNARLSAEMLRRDGVERVYLVTHAWHVPRARSELERQGLAVVPAPTGFRAAPTWGWATFAPSAKALRESAWAAHEWLGRLWYAITA
jgi:uncharacterized SAM-binding protein YcdF (DUF218 family)